MILSLFATAAPVAGAQDGSDDGFIDGSDTDILGTDFSEVEPLPGEEDGLAPEVIDPSMMLRAADLGIPETGEPEIVGGSTTTISKHPWQIQLWIVLPDGRRAFFCGGSIVRDDVIVTAAHCLDDLDVLGFDDDLQITAGSTFESITAGQQREVTSYTQHGSWNPNSRNGAGNGYDIAVMKLASPLNFNKNVQPIPLATASELNSATTARTSGWGDTSQGGSPSDQLRQVNVPIYSDQFCDNLYGGVIADNREVCAGGLTGVDSCQGDSGGPLTINVDGVRKLAGIVSWGSGCAAGFPGVYAQIENFAGWMLKKMPTRKCGGFKVTVDIMLGQTPTNGNDVIAGTPWPDVINAKKGHDRVCGMDGSDVISGGNGNDRIYGGNGYDKLVGDRGNDILRGGNGKDTLKGKGGKDTLIGGNGNSDVCKGGNGVDVLDNSCETKQQ